MPDLSTVDSPNAASTLGGYLQVFERDVQHQGLEYYRSGQVLRIEATDEHTVTASVQGGSRFTVNLTRDGPVWHSNCTCPVHHLCKHSYAAALAWFDEVNRRHLPEPDAKTKLKKPPEVEIPEETADFRDKWEPVLQRELGRSLAPADRVFLGKIGALFAQFEQAGSLSVRDLVKFGLATREAKRGSFDLAYRGWWTEPPGDALALWQYVAYDIESSGLPVPPFMLPLTDTSKVKQALAERDRMEAVARWTRRFDRLLEAGLANPIAEETVEKTFEVRLCLGRDKWVLETRSGAGDAWKPAPRAFVDRFIRNTGSSPADLAPEVFSFLTILQEHYRQHFTISLSPANSAARQLLQRLLSHRLARNLVTGPGGAPLVFATEPLVWRFEESSEDERDLEVTLVRPDGEPLRPGAAHLDGRPDLYLDDGIVYRGPPPLDGVSATAAIVPAEVVARPVVLRSLRLAGARLPAKLKERFVEIALRGRVECRLEKDFNGEILSLDLLSVTDEPPIRQRWAPGGWLWLSPEHQYEASPDGRGIYVFERSEAERAALQLEEFGLIYEPANQRWVRRVTKTFAEDFTTWRSSLPPGIEFVATGELASLLSAPVRARVEFELIESPAHRDWFDLALALRPEDSLLTQEDIALLLKARGKFVRLAGKGWRRLHVEVDAAAVDALEETGFDADTLAEAAGAGERHRFHALQLAQAPIADLLPERQALALRGRARELALPETPALPAGLRAELRPYQREGFQFLAFLTANRLGGVLADDMGLGKTLQTLAWLLWLAEQQPTGKPLLALVVCPKSVVFNWETETARFAPSLAVTRFNPDFARDGLPDSGGQPRIVTANYTQLRIHDDFFKAQRWDAVILDEGQFIKNPASKVAQTARELPGELRLVLTGTPIENRLLDLWSLFAFALPGLLGTQASFKRHYSDDDPLALARLRTRVRHFLLRRTKAQVAVDLPPRTEEDIVVELEGEQARLYQAELKRARAQLLRVDTDRQLDKVRFNILSSLLRLRQICCHPALIDPTQIETPSAKLEALLEHLEELRAEGHQVLVFSQFVTMLAIIHDRLVALGVNHLLLTGQTEDREALVAQFQSDRSQTVFLLSLKAAGFGLNLTAASYVILYDPWWNPAVEAQAIDRTHRIGQSVPVMAYRLIARGTVEEKIRALQHEKAALAGAIVQEESLASILNLDTLRHVLS